mgnify:FL=1
MITTKNIENSNSNTPAILTIGTFDGVHLGHKKIIKKLVESAKKRKLRACILTFFPHPRNFLSKSNELKMINTINEKKEILSELGVDELIIQEFNNEFSNLSANEFIKHLLKFCEIKEIIVGFNHKFGKDREAGIDELKIYGKRYGFDVCEIDAFDINQINVSSTKIRNAIGEGQVDLCKQYLGYNFSIGGNIVEGKSRGKKIGFPTANIKVEENYKIIPKNGVYFVSCKIRNVQKFGMMNIGFNPTFGNKKLTIEVNIFDFEQDVYGENVRIEFIKFIRNEIKFQNIDELIKQIKIDRETCKSYMNSTYNN